MEQRLQKGKVRSGVSAVLVRIVSYSVLMLLLTGEKAGVEIQRLHGICTYERERTRDAGQVQGHVTQPEALERGRRDTVLPAETPIRALQYNVQFLLPELALHFTSTEEIGHWPNTTERALVIGQALAEGCFDIIALNETVNERRREEIVTALEKTAIECAGPPGMGGSDQLYVASGPDLNDASGLHVVDDLVALLLRGQDATLNDAVVGDELTIISRFPIVETHSLIFNDSAGIDVGAAKGVLHARLWRGEGYPATAMIDVFATHLQAGDHQAIRRSQLEDLTGFIRARRHPSIPFVVLGDFNIDGSQKAQAAAQSAYRDSLQPWVEALGLEDSGRLLETGTDGDSGERIDYIFVSGNGLDVLRANVESYACTDLDLSFCSDTYPTLSDHAAMSADLLWQHGQPCVQEGDTR